MRCTRQTQAAQCLRTSEMDAETYSPSLNATTGVQLLTDAMLTTMPRPCPRKAIREHTVEVKLTAKLITAGTNPTLTWGFCLEKFETETTRLLLLRLPALSATRLLSNLVDKPG